MSGCGERVIGRSSSDFASSLPPKGTLRRMHTSLLRNVFPRLPIGTLATISPLTGPRSRQRERIGTGRTRSARSGVATVGQSPIRLLTVFPRQMGKARLRELLMDEPKVNPAFLKPEAVMQSVAKALEGDQKFILKGLVIKNADGTTAFVGQPTPASHLPNRTVNRGPSAESEILA